MTVLAVTVPAVPAASCTRLLGFPFPQVVFLRKQPSGQLGRGALAVSSLLWEGKRLQGVCSAEEAQGHAVGTLPCPFLRADLAEGVLVWCVVTRICHLPAAARPLFPLSAKMPMCCCADLPLSTREMPEVAQAAPGKVRFGKKLVSGLLLCSFLVNNNLWRGTPRREGAV